jgi:hypothetical protein
MLEKATTQGYRWLAKAVLYKALVDARNAGTRGYVLRFMRGNTCGVFCAMANINEESLRNAIIVPKTQPKPVDVYCDGKRIARCSSLNVAHLTTGDSISAIIYAIQWEGETKRGYKYRKAHS